MIAEQAPAVRPLCSAPPDTKIRPSPITPNEAAERTADVTLGIDVGVIQHGVAVATNFAAAVGFALHQHAETRCIARAHLRRSFIPRSPSTSKTPPMSSAS